MGRGCPSGRSVPTASASIFWAFSAAWPSASPWWRLLEYRDTSFKTDDDIVTTLALPVLAVIPAMTSAAERRAFRRRQILLAASISVVCMMLAGAVMAVWRYRLVDAWLR